MNPPQWARVKNLFHAALDRAPEERDRFLAEACGERDDERLEVERLLAAHYEAGTFIEHSPVGGILRDEAKGPMTGRLLGQYEVGRLLGSGGMGVVYAARDMELDRVVALKFVTGDSPEADAGLRREARRASQLNHPNVCTIHQVGAAGGTTFFVMEYVAGETLDAAIGPGGLPLDALVNYASQIAAAVGHAHDRGLLHRDLKSANVMLTPDGRIKVLDFGLAAPIGRRASELSQSHASLAAGEPVAGTLPYMAPELLLAKPPGPRSDIWAFGVLLYEMAIGRRPFEGTTGFELCAAILSREPAPLPDRVPDALRALIARTLLKNPDERCASVAEVAAALDGLRVPTGAASAELSGARLAASRLPGSLPSSRTSFVGRVEELLRFEHELEAAGMVTLTGVGGSGKTRLALRMAEQARPRFPGGVWWVDLAPLSDGARVDEAVATVFGVLNAQRSPRDSMLEWLVGRRLLLVLDNCEHVVSAVSDLADEILAASEDVRILATSREGLGVPGERIVAVPSLSTPPADAAGDTTALAQSDAVRLFVERAAGVHPGFELTAANGPVILDICRRLDGIPLGIELAAAHARLLSVEQIRERLKDRLTLLSGRTRAVARHQTLGATLQWSYDLLTPDEQRALQRLSVFQGAWALPSAAAVMADVAREPDVLDVLWRLVDKSLVQVVHTEGSEARYRLLEMVRQFAYERLVTAGEAPATRARHAAHYLDRLERTVPDLLGPSETRAVAAIDQDLDNLLAAVEAHGGFNRDLDRMLSAVGRAWLFWIVRGRLGLARSAITAIMEETLQIDPLARAEALIMRSMCARFAGDGAAALTDAEAAVALIEPLQEERRTVLPFALFQRAITRMIAGADGSVVTADLERCEKLSRPAGDRLALGVALNLAALLSQSDGDLARAEILLTEALETARSLRSPYLQILYQGNLSGVHADGKRWIDAVAMLQEALDLVRRTGNRHFGTGALLLTARILLGVGQVADAMRLAAAAGRLSAEIGEAPPPDEVKGLERDLDAAGIDAADEAYAAFRGAGLTLSFEAAIDEAARGLQGIAARGPGPAGEQLGGPGR